MRSKNNVFYNFTKIISVVYEIFIFINKIPILQQLISFSGIIKEFYLSNKPRFPWQRFPYNRPKNDY